MYAVGTMAERGIEVILTFCNPCIFFSHAFAYTSCVLGCSAMNTEELIMNTEQEIWNFFAYHKHFKCFSKCIEITPCCTHMFFWEVQEVQRGAQGGERWLKEWKASNMLDWGQCCTGKAVGEWHSSNDHKPAGHEKGQCLEESHWRFGHVENLHKNDAKTEDCWMMIRRNDLYRCVKTSTE